MHISPFPSRVRFSLNVKRMVFTKSGPTGLSIAGQDFPTFRNFPHRPLPSFYPSSASFRKPGHFSPSLVTQGWRFRSLSRVQAISDEGLGLNTAQTTSKGFAEQRREAKRGLLTRFTTAKELISENFLSGTEKPSLIPGLRSISAAPSIAQAIEHSVILRNNELRRNELATGSLDLHGWKVLLRDTKEMVGIVDEIIHIGSVDSDEIFESVLKVVYTSRSQSEDFGDSAVDTEDTEENEDLDYLEFLVPLVEDIVGEVDVENSCLFITPPEGLLELARIPQLLKELEPKLLEFCRHQNDGIRGCLNSVRASKNGRFSDDAKQLLAWKGRWIEERFEIFMPTRRQLTAARRHDLVEDIMAAGGFLAVAQSLKLPSRRRPNGFWEDIRNLDAEIEWFVSSSWTYEEDPATGMVLDLLSPETREPVYCNQATGEVSSAVPSPGSVSNPVPVSQDSFDACTAVMPRQRRVLAAGRYDLHHAILAHGGYKLVARELGRQPVSKDTNIVMKIKSFMKERSTSHFPSLKELRACGRHDLAYLLRRQGGLNVVSDMMDMRPKRYGRGQWSDMEVAAAAIQTYMCNKLILERGLDESAMDRSDLEQMVWKDALRASTLVIPSQTAFLKVNRSDLRYLLQKFGRKELSQYLGIDIVPRGRIVSHLKW